MIACNDLKMQLCVPSTSLCCSLHLPFKKVSHMIATYYFHFSRCIKQMLIHHDLISYATSSSAQFGSDIIAKPFPIAKHCKHNCHMNAHTFGLLNVYDENPNKESTLAATSVFTLVHLICSFRMGTMFGHSSASLSWLMLPHHKLD